MAKNLQPVWTSLYYGHICTVINSCAMLCYDQAYYNTNNRSASTTLVVILWIACFYLCRENSAEWDDAAIFFTEFSHGRLIICEHITKDILRKVYLYWAVSALHGSVWFQRLTLKRSELTPKLTCDIYSKIAIKQGKFIYLSHIQGVFPSILYLPCHTMIACFHELLALELWNYMTCIFPIVMIVNLLTDLERPLSISLKRLLTMKIQSIICNKSCPSHVWI